MPTENRYSNTENAPCPFCGGQVDPEGWLRGDGARGPECESCGATAPHLALWNGAQPAQQHLAEPVPAFENCIDARAYIADLFRQRLRRCDFDQYIAERLAGDFAFALANWLVTERQQAQQRQGEPVALPARKPWDGLAATGENLKVSGWNEYRDAVEKLGPLYTHADPAEVERLRAVIEQQKNLIESLRAELVESHSIDASAEPSAPVTNEAQP